MLQEAKDLQNEAVSKLVRVISEDKKEFTFKAPTGSGKTYMMADFMNRILVENEKNIFIVSTLSKSNLAEQNYKSFKKLSENGTFSKLKPFLVNSDSSGEGSLYIPTNCNVYVLPRDLYKDKAKLKKEGTLLNFLQSMTSPIFSKSQQKTIYLIKDECHILTSNLDSIQNYFSKIINFSATPNLGRKQNPDVEITNEQAESAKLIKKVEIGNEEDSLESALDKFEQIKANYTNLLSVNPCMIIQISNKQKATEELKNNILPSLLRHQDLKWVYITGEDKSCDTNDSGLKKLPVSKWKDYIKNDPSISIIIFKMVISEGYDIPRACMLYQIRDSKSKQLDEQVMGRVRRNPRLLDFETLSEEAQNLAMTAWIWGIVPTTTGGTKQVRLIKNYGIEKQVRITPTKLQNISASKSFDVASYIQTLKSDELAHQSIFEMYRNLTKQDNEIQKMCYEYADNYSKWCTFSENLKNIKATYDSYICDYEKSMYTCEQVSFPIDSCFVETENDFPIDNWVWARSDNETEFSFDSVAERKWAQVLYGISFTLIDETQNTELNFGEKFNSCENKFLWGKNFPYNSEIKFEYYLNGVHSSYPDFVMKDKNGRIHIFEVKSVNESGSLNIDKDEYEQKIRAIKECYKMASKKTNHIFYLPILKDSVWQITKYENGSEEKITKDQFVNSIKQSVDYKIESDFSVLKVADSE